MQKNCPYLIAMQVCKRNKIPKKIFTKNRNDIIVGGNYIYKHNYLHTQKKRCVKMAMCFRAE